MKARIAGYAAAVVAALCGANTAAAQDDGPWEVRLRAVILAMSQGSDGYAPLGIPDDAIHVNDKWIPDLDIERFFAEHWSAELLLTYPQNQTVTVEKSALGGPVAIGSFRHLPPTITAKYHFLPDQPVQPYVGVGLNVTLIWGDSLTVPTVGRLDLDHVSVGAAAQVGFDLKVAEHWYANMDAKWVMLRSDVKFQGVQISQVQLDPWLIGVGVGYRF